MNELLFSFVSLYILFPRVDGCTISCIRFLLGLEPRLKWMALLKLIIRQMKYACSFKSVLHCYGVMPVYLLTVIFQNVFSLMKIKFCNLDFRHL